MKKAFHKRSFINGIKHSAPVCIAYLCMYGAIGIMACANNLTLSEIVTMTATIFAVPLQSFLIYNQDLSTTSLVLDVFIINFRLLLMSVVLLTMWKQPKIIAAPSLLFCCASNYMVSIAEKKHENSWSFYIGLTIIVYVVAVFSSILGYYLYQINSENLRVFLGAIANIVMPIPFTCLAIKREKIMVAVTTLLGLIISPTITFLIGKGYVIFCFIGISILLVLLEEKLCPKQS